MASRLPETGELTRKIRIRLWTDVPNVTFGLTQTFNEGFKRWAKKEPINSLTLLHGENTSEVPTDLFWVRYASLTRPEDLTTEHVIELDGKRYRILSVVDVDDQQRFTRIAAKYLEAIQT
jgi:SPP1 family predicted phage head-tail adaptor